MLGDNLRRGFAVGAVGGLYYGLFVVLVGDRLVVLAERFEAGPAEAAGTLLSAATNFAAGAVWGVLLGVVAFGLVFGVVEPAIPGPAEGRSYLLGAAGFVTVSGAPWLVLPPLPPGVESGLPTDTRLAWYGVMVLAGAVVCGLGGRVYVELRDRGRVIAAAASALALVGLLVPAALAPANPVSGPAPPELVDAFRWVTVFGQVSLWIVLASTHAALIQRAGRQPSQPGS